MVENAIIFFPLIVFSAKGYLKRVKEDPEAVVLLGDSAYNRSALKEELGIGRPVPLRKDGVQQRVSILSVFVQKKANFVDRVRK